jgi:hypothetical protein
MRLRAFDMSPKGANVNDRGWNEMEPTVGKQQTTLRPRRGRIKFIENYPLLSLHHKHPVNRKIGISVVAFLIRPLR